MRAFTFSKVTKLALAAVPVFVTVMVLTAGIAGATQDAGRGRIDQVRDATARYQSLSVAGAHGYGLLKDAAGIACIDKPGVGAMGVHYVNGQLVGTAEVDPLQPEALVYEPDQDGQLRLVAVEYVTFQAQWDATHKARPRLFGQPFMLTPAGNRFGLPAFYSLHAWIWKSNPDGMFAMWNPTVHCPSA
jgi:hypothetical protein